MSIRTRVALAAAAALIALSSVACATPAGSASSLPEPAANACAAMDNFASAVLQFEGVDVTTLNPTALAPQVNRIRSTFSIVASSLQLVDVPSEGELESAWTVFETALTAIDPNAPTPESVEAAKAAAGDVKVAYAKVQTELGCPSS